MEPLQGRGDLRDREAGPGRVVGLALALEQVGTEDQGDQMRRIQGQRALNRALFGRLVLELPRDQREIDPLLRVRTFCVDDALERRPGGLEISVAKGALAERGQGAHMARVDFKNSTPEGDSHIVPPRLDGSESLRLEDTNLL